MYLSNGLRLTSKLHMKTYTLMFIAALVRTDKNWKETDVQKRFSQPR